MFAYQGRQVGLRVFGRARSMSSGPVVSGRQLVDSPDGREARPSLDLNPLPTVFVLTLDRFSVSGLSHLTVVVIPVLLAWLVTGALVAKRVATAGPRCLGCRSRRNRC
jgi:hypothetical protein